MSGLWASLTSLAALCQSARYTTTLAALAAVWLVLTLPWWFAGLAVPEDSQNYYYPMLRGLARHLAAGDWPLWLPETYAGRPALADPQSMVAQPSFLALAWLIEQPSQQAMDMLVLAHLLLGAAALAVWALRRDAEPLAALLAALVFAFGGAAMARLEHTFLVISYAWIPVVILAIEWLLQRPSWRRGLAVGLLMTVLTLNRDHVAFQGHLVIAAAALLYLLSAPEPLRRLRRSAPAIPVALALWLALIALPIAVSLAYVAESNRPGFTADLAANMALPWASLLTLPFPNLFDQLAAAKADYWGPASAGWSGLWYDRAVVQLACGVPVAAIFVWLGVLRGGLLAAGARFGAIVAVLALLYAVGPRTPVFGLIFDYVPGFALFQRPADAAFVFNLGLAFATVGVAGRYLIHGIEPVALWRRCAEMALALCLIAAAIALAFHFGRLADAWPSVLGPALLAALTVGILVAGNRRHAVGRRGAMALIVLLTVADLWLHNAGTALNARPTATAAPLAQPQDDIVLRWLNERLVESGDAAPRVEILGLGGPWQNVPHAAGFEATLGYNPLRSSRFQMATGAGQNSHAPRRRWGTLMTGYAAPFTDLLGVRYIVLGAPMETIDVASAGAFAAPTVLRDAFLKDDPTPEEPRGDVYIYENTNWVPRFVLIAASEVCPHDPDDLLNSGALPTFDGRRQALIENPGPPSEASGNDTFAGALDVEQHGPDTSILRVTTDRSAWLVFHEMADPGWAAWVDGERRPVHRANVLFQAVRVEPGDQEVTFSYAPWRAALALFRPATEADDGPLDDRARCLDWNEPADGAARLPPTTGHAADYRNPD